MGEPKAEIDRKQAESGELAAAIDRLTRAVRTRASDVVDAAALLGLGADDVAVPINIGDLRRVLRALPCPRCGWTGDCDPRSVSCHVISPGGTDG